MANLNTNFFNKKNSNQILKFGITGILGTVLHFIILIILVENFQINVLIATTIAFFCATIFNFLLNKFWTFKQPKKVEGQFLRYLFIVFCGALLNLLFIYLGETKFEIDYRISQIIATFFVAIWNFWGTKKFVFADRRLPKKEFEIHDNFPYDLSIIIPAYNEENRIKKTLRAIRDYLETSNLNAEIIVVDDHSSDKTSEVVKNFQNIKNLRAVRQEVNTGKGGAIRRGFQEATGKYTLFMDADNSTHIKEFEKMRPSLDKTPIVIGSRYTDTANQTQEQNLARRILSRGGNKLIRNLLKFPLRDTQCGFKVFYTPVSKFLAERQRIERFAFDMEILAIATLHRIPVKEIGVEWENDENTKVQFFRDSYRSLRDLGKIKINLWKGRYK
jgi:putative flippase GtrA/nicotinic acid mononucleotide adenylyltransferase